MLVSSISVIKIMGAQDIPNIEVKPKLYRTEERVTVGPIYSQSRNSVM